MRKFDRPAEPTCLTENWVKWTRQYFNRRKSGKGTFYWNRYPNSNSNPINHILRKLLLDSTQHHCAYCDRFPLFPSDETIDHFKPKSIYPLGAYKWSNLFPACDNCQTSKLDQYNSHILKPDEISYEFNRFFFVDYTTYRLVANPIANKFDRKKANTTIALFDLNNNAHCTSRRHSMERELHSLSFDINDYGYRYIFD